MIAILEVRAVAILLQKYSTHVTNADGATYVVCSYGDERATGRETSQPNRLAVQYWATGLEPIYFEGALARAA